MQYVFCDIVGVLHDNHAVFEGIIEKLASFKQCGIKVILLSNTPRRAFKVQQLLNSFGISNDLYFEIVSSGEVFYQTMKNTEAQYFFVGMEKDLDLMDGTQIQLETKNTEECNFAIISGFRNRGDDISSITETLKQMQSCNLKAYCINPDLHVVKKNGEIAMLCAGTIAKEYEKLGGVVEYFGKPYNNVYDYAWNLLGKPSKNQITAIGEAMNTDIKGAKKFGVKSILVNSGLHQNDLNFLNKFGFKPDVIIDNFSMLDL